MARGVKDGLVLCSWRKRKRRPSLTDLGEGFSELLLFLGGHWCGGGHVGSLELGARTHPT